MPQPCIVFPLPRPATQPFWDGHQQSFGGPRDRGNRFHAAVDLEAAAGTPVLAMADGIVILASPVFYQNTGVIEIEHPGLGIIRYGEIDPHKSGLLVYVGKWVWRGQVIGFVGKRDKATRYMLHLECMRIGVTTILRLENLEHTH